jgi:hypothetical protein
VLECNGISEEQLVSRADRVEHIEMFLFNYGKMLGLSFFQVGSHPAAVQRNTPALPGRATRFRLLARSAPEVTFASSYSLADHIPSQLNGPPSQLWRW